MIQNYARPLHDKNLVQHFLESVLQYKNEQNSDLIDKISKAEESLTPSKKDHPTLTHTEHRSRKYKDDLDRWALRKQIVNELLTLKRLSDDDEICLGNGGALPKGELRAEKQAFIIIGLPASGKSSIASRIADEYGAIVIDSDFAKRKLPEYKDSASLVHEESSAITVGFGSVSPPDKIQSLYEECLQKGYNVVIPKIGNTVSGILKIAKPLKDDQNYDVHLILISLLKREATIRAMLRFCKSERYVPLSLIFDGYGNDPCLCYYFLRCKYAHVFKSFGAISTDVPEGEAPYCTDREGETPASFYVYKDEIII
jgi:hypothetical protein